ncbi:DUF4350 domain-containing protein [Thermococcus sp.]
MKRLALLLIVLIVAGVMPLYGAGYVGASPSQGYIIKAVNVTASADAYSAYKYGKYYKWYSYHEYNGKYELAVGNTSYYSRERAYLRFNLSSIPAVAKIESAQLCVYIAYIKYFDTPMNVGVYNITNDWKEDYTKPAPEPGLLLDNKTLSKGWVCFNVTDYVKSKFSEQTVFSFLLKLVNESVSNYAWIYSRENPYDRPVLRVSYYVPIAISSLSVAQPAYAGLNAPVKATITNGGSKSQDVEYLILINGQVVYNETVSVPAGSEVEVEYDWVPPEEGYYTVTAEILGNGFSDKSSSTVYVYTNPYRMFFGLSTFYENLYTEEFPVVSALYENLTSTVEKLQSCGVNLGDLKGDVQWINSTYKEMLDEYQLFLKMKAYAPLLINGNRLYSYPLMIHIRKAAFLGRDLQGRIEKVLPILQKTLEKVEPLCKSKLNQTNQTAGNITAPTNGTVSNQTNVSPSNVTNVTIHITRVLIDASHGQYYINKYGIENLKSYIENELGWEVNVSYVPLTQDVLKNYDIVILTNPKSDLSEAEIQALQQFVENGGGLFVAGDWYKYVNAKSLNALVKKFGIEFEKTELMDDANNSGKPYYPFVGIYNRETPITKFIPDGWKMYYNGDTLKVSGNALWVIRAFSTGYAVDSGDNVVYAEGSEPIVAAAVQVGKGRIVAYGSSKALSDAYYSKYIKSNWPFIKGALLWLAHED